MDPARELTELAARKIALQQDIARRRADCATALAAVARPLEWLDGTFAFCRRFSPFAPFAAVALGWFLQRAVFPRRKALGWLGRWGPLVFRAVRLIGTVGKVRFETAGSPNDAGRPRGPDHGENGSPGVGAPPGERRRWH